MAILRQSYDIEIAKHESSGLYLAQSRDLPALMVPANSIAELEERISQSVREILEHTGVRVLNVELVADAT